MRNGLVDYPLGALCCIVRIAPAPVARIDVWKRSAGTIILGGCSEVLCNDHQPFLLYLLLKVG